MAYFNHAFCKSFLVTDVANTPGVLPQDLVGGQLGIADGSWGVLDPTSIPLPPVTPLAKNMFYFAQGSFMPNDSVGTHGGYQESVKSKGVNPKYITRLWSSVCQPAVASTVQICVGPTCAPCGENLFIRVDVKGSPALRFLNHNAYAIGDSSGSAAINAVPGNCCIDGQDYLDPAVALAKAAAMLLEDPIIQPFVQEAGAGGIVVAGGAQAGTYTIAQALDGVTYVPSTDPVGDGITEVCLTFEGAYADTQFGDCSFDTRDHYEMEPVQLVGSVLDETGDPCNDCGVVTSTPGEMAQTHRGTVLRALLLHERYLQSPYHQGSSDSVRIREIEGFDAIKAAVDADFYKVYYLQHSIPRLNNPTGTFDNDQYINQFFVECGSGAEAEMEGLFAQIEALSNAFGNPISFEGNIDLI